MQIINYAICASVVSKNSAWKMKYILKKVKRTQPKNIAKGVSLDHMLQMASQTSVQPMAKLIIQKKI